MRIVHVTLWDVRSVLPLGNGPAAASWGYRHAVRPFIVPGCPGWFLEPKDIGLQYGIDAWLFQLAKIREGWLDARRACTGRWLKRHHLRECFDSTTDPTCPECLALWHTVLVMRDRRLEQAT